MLKEVVVVFPQRERGWSSSVKGIGFPKNGRLPKHRNGRGGTFDVLNFTGNRSSSMTLRKAVIALLPPCDSRKKEWITREH
jgi:hypothetical protein